MLFNVTYVVYSRGECRALALRVFDSYLRVEGFDSSSVLTIPRL